MHKLAERDLCSGCAACSIVCPRCAIEMAPDVEGFRYPILNVSKCIDCGLCNRVCPSLHPDAERLPVSVFAAQAKDDGLRMESSSGGIFSLLARQVLANGGVVYGAAVRLTDGKVVHQSAETEYELFALRGSKYVQSDVGNVYIKAKEQVMSGRSVLFSGTPCQIAAFRRVLGCDRENLLCVEVICHGVPSPLAWEKFLENRLTEQNQGRDSARDEGPPIKRISFRRKNCGWKRYSLSLRFANDREYLKDLQHDTFLRGFLNELYNRPSCHRCSLRGLCSGADITLGDFWKVGQWIAGIDDDHGTSLVLINTERGKRAFDSVKGCCRFINSSFDVACRSNSPLVKSPHPHARRTKFFKLMHGGVDFDCSVDICLRLPLTMRIRAQVGRFLRKIGLRK